MNKKIINQRAEEILREIEKLTSTIRAMERCDVENNLENFELLSTDAALRAELITCRLRHLVYSSTSVKSKSIWLRRALSRALRFSAKMIF